MKNINIDTFIMNNDHLLYYLCTEPPGPPAFLKVADSTKTSITLSWSRPVYDGGAPIINYSLDLRLKTDADPENPSVGWKRIDTHGPLVLTEFTIGQLDEKLEYDFKVSAQNQVGWGRHAYLREAASPKEILGETCVHLRYHTFLQIFFMDNCY